MAHLSAGMPSWAVTVPTVVLAATILCHRALTTGLQCDELLFLRAVELGPLKGLMAAGSSHPPLLRWLLAPLGGSSAPDWLLRLPSILASAGCIVVWGAILRRMIPDAATVWLLLPAMAVGQTFLAQGYQCVPYALLTLLASFHCLCWFWLLERGGRFSGVLLVLSGVLAAWTHFYGVHLLVADQLVWGLLVYRRMMPLRAWFAAAFTAIMLILPLVPIVAFYLHNDRPYPISQIADYGSYFMAASAFIFSETTFFGVLTAVPFYLLWYVAAAALVGRALGSGGGPGEGRSPQGFHGRETTALAVAAIVCGAFAAGFPAFQLQSLIFGKSMSARYAVAGVWIHWPMMVMLIFGVCGHRAARGVAAVVFATGVIALMLCDPHHTQDYRPVISHLRTQGRPGDAFLAQDMDMWVGRKNFDRLWFRRYVRLEMPIFSGPAIRRAELYSRGLPLQAADRSVSRIWVYSHLFLEEWLRDVPADGWKLAALHTFGGSYPLALLVREGEGISGTVLPSGCPQDGP